MDEDKKDINPYDLGPEEVRRYLTNEIKVSESSVEAQKHVSRAVGFLNEKLETKKMSLEEAGSFAIDIFNSWSQANQNLIDAGGISAGVNESLIEDTRQLVALSFGIDLSQEQEEHI